MFLLNIFEVKDITLAHKHLELVQQEANKGTLHAMVTLSRLHGNKHDRTLFNMRLSARWAHLPSLFTRIMKSLWTARPPAFRFFLETLSFALVYHPYPEFRAAGQVNSMV